LNIRFLARPQLSMSGYYAAKSMPNPEPESCTAATSGRALPAFSFGYLSVECPFDEFHGIDCRPELGAKLLDRFFHRRRQLAPPVNGAAHRLFDGRYHLLDRHVAVNLRHGPVASLSGCSCSIRLGIDYDTIGATRLLPINADEPSKG